MKNKIYCLIIASILLLSNVNYTFVEAIQIGCISRAYTQCDGNMVYWYDTCGNKGNIKETCAARTKCENGKCIACVSHSSMNCNLNKVYWYDSCGNIEDIKEDCASQKKQCKDGECITCDSHNSTQCVGNYAYWYDSCGNKEGMKEFCPISCKDGQCVSCIPHKSYKCFGGNIYWYNSCDIKEGIKEACYGGFCKDNQCCKSHDNFKCYGQNVFWYDSCDVKEEIKEDCFNDCCQDGMCIPCDQVIQDVCKDVKCPPCTICNSMGMTGECVEAYGCGNNGGDTGECDMICKGFNYHYGSCLSDAYNQYANQNPNIIHTIDKVNGETKRGIGLKALEGWGAYKCTPAFDENGKIYTNSQECGCYYLNCNNVCKDQVGGIYGTCITGDRCLGTTVGDTSSGFCEVAGTRCCCFTGISGGCDADDIEGRSNPSCYRPMEDVIAEMCGPDDEFCPALTKLSVDEYNALSEDGKKVYDSIDDAGGVYDKGEGVFHGDLLAGTFKPPPGSCCKKDELCDKGKCTSQKDKNTCTNREERRSAPDVLNEPYGCCKQTLCYTIDEIHEVWNPSDGTCEIVGSTNSGCEGSGADSSKCGFSDEALGLADVAGGAEGVVLEGSQTIMRCESDSCTCKAQSIDDVTPDPCDPCNPQGNCFSNQKCCEEVAYKCNNDRIEWVPVGAESAGAGGYCKCPEGSKRVDTNQVDDYNKNKESIKGKEDRYKDLNQENQNNRNQINTLKNNINNIQNDNTLSEDEKREKTISINEQIDGLINKNKANEDELKQIRQEMAVLLDEQKDIIDRVKSYGFSEYTSKKYIKSLIEDTKSMSDASINGAIDSLNAEIKNLEIQLTAVSPSERRKIGKDINELIKKRESLKDEMDSIKHFTDKSIKELDSKDNFASVDEGVRIGIEYFFSNTNGKEIENKKAALAHLDMIDFINTEAMKGNKDYFKSMVQLSMVTDPATIDLITRVINSIEENEKKLEEQRKKNEEKNSQLKEILTKGSGISVKLSVYKKDVEDIDKKINDLQSKLDSGAYAEEGIDASVIQDQISQLKNEKESIINEIDNGKKEVLDAFAKLIEGAESQSEKDAITQAMLNTQLNWAKSDDDNSYIKDVLADKLPSKNDDPRAGWDVDGDGRIDFDKKGALTSAGSAYEEKYPLSDVWKIKLGNRDIDGDGALDIYNGEAVTDTGESILSEVEQLSSLSSLSNVCLGDYKISGIGGAAVASLTGFYSRNCPTPDFNKYGEPITEKGRAVAAMLSTKRGEGELTKENAIALADNIKFKKDYDSAMEYTRSESKSLRDDAWDKLNEFANDLNTPIQGSTRDLIKDNIQLRAAQKLKLDGKYKLAKFIFDSIAGGTTDSGLKEFARQESFSCDHSLTKIDGIMGNRKAEPGLIDYKGYIEKFGETEGLKKAIDDYMVDRITSYLGNKPQEPKMPEKGWFQTQESYQQALFQYYDDLDTHKAEKAAYDKRKDEINTEIITLLNTIPKEWASSFKSYMEEDLKNTQGFIDNPMGVPVKKMEEHKREIQSIYFYFLNKEYDSANERERDFLKKQIEQTIQQLEDEGKAYIDTPKGKIYSKDYDFFTRILDEYKSTDKYSQKYDSLPTEEKEKFSTLAYYKTFTRAQEAKDKLYEAEQGFSLNQINQKKIEKEINQLKNNPSYIEYESHRYAYGTGGLEPIISTPSEQVQEIYSQIMQKENQINALKQQEETLKAEKNTYSERTLALTISLASLNSVPVNQLEAHRNMIETVYKNLISSNAEIRMEQVQNYLDISVPGYLVSTGPVRALEDTFFTKGNVGEFNSAHLDQINEVNAITLVGTMRKKNYFTQEEIMSGYYYDPNYDFNKGMRGITIDEISKRMGLTNEQSVMYLNAMENYRESDIASAVSYHDNYDGTYSTSIGDINVDKLAVSANDVLTRAGTSIQLTETINLNFGAEIHQNLEESLGVDVLDWFDQMFNVQTVVAMYVGSNIINYGTQALAKTLPFIEELLSTKGGQAFTKIFQISGEAEESFTKQALTSLLGRQRAAEVMGGAALKGFGERVAVHTVSIASNSLFEIGWEEGLYTSAGNIIASFVGKHAGRALGDFAGNVPDLMEMSYGIAAGKGGAIASNIVSFISSTSGNVELFQTVTKANLQETLNKYSNLEKGNYEVRKVAGFEDAYQVVDLDKGVIVMNIGVEDSNFVAQTKKNILVDANNEILVTDKNEIVPVTRVAGDINEIKTAMGKNSVVTDLSVSEDGKVLTYNEDGKARVIATHDVELPTELSVKGGTTNVKQSSIYNSVYNMIANNIASGSPNPSLMKAVAETEGGIVAVADEISSAIKQSSWKGAAVLQKYGIVDNSLSPAIGTVMEEDGMTIALDSRFLEGYTASASTQLQADLIEIKSKISDKQKQISNALKALDEGKTKEEAMAEIKDDQLLEEINREIEEGGEINSVLQQAYVDAELRKTKTQAIFDSITGQYSETPDIPLKSTAIASTEGVLGTTTTDEFGNLNIDQKKTVVDQLPGMYKGYSQQEFNEKHGIYTNVVDENGNLIIASVYNSDGSIDLNLEHASLQSEKGLRGAVAREKVLYEFSTMTVTQREAVVSTFTSSNNWVETEEGYFENFVEDTEHVIPEGKTVADFGVGAYATVYGYTDGMVVEDLTSKYAQAKASDDTSGEAEFVKSHVGPLTDDLRIAYGIANVEEIARNARDMEIPRYSESLESYEDEGKRTIAEQILTEKIETTSQSVREAMPVVENEVVSVLTVNNKVETCSSCDILIPQVRKLREEGRLEEALGLIDKALNPLVKNVEKGTINFESKNYAESIQNIENAISELEGYANSDDLRAQLENLKSKVQEVKESSQLLDNIQKGGEVPSKLFEAPKPSLSPNELEKLQKPSIPGADPKTEYPDHVYKNDPNYPFKKLPVSDNRGGMSYNSRPGYETEVETEARKTTGKVIAFDLDQTLIWNIDNTWDTSPDAEPSKIGLRPGILSLLKGYKAGNIIVLYTSAHKEWANFVLDSFPQLREAFGNNIITREDYEASSPENARAEGKVEYSSDKTPWILDKPYHIIFDDALAFFSESTTNLDDAWINNARAKEGDARADVLEMARELNRRVNNEEGAKPGQQIAAESDIEGDYQIFEREYRVVDDKFVSPTPTPTEIPRKLPVSEPIVNFVSEGETSREDMLNNGLFRKGGKVGLEYEGITSHHDETMQILAEAERHLLQLKTAVELGIGGITEAAEILAIKGIKVYTVEGKYPEGIKQGLVEEGIEAIEGDALNELDPNVEGSLAHRLNQEGKKIDIVYARGFFESAGIDSHGADSWRRYPQNTKEAMERINQLQDIGGIVVIIYQATPKDVRELSEYRRWGYKVIAGGRMGPSNLFLTVVLQKISDPVPVQNQPKKEIESDLKTGEEFSPEAKKVVDGVSAGNIQILDGVIAEVFKSEPDKLNKWPKYSQEFAQNKNRRLGILQELGITGNLAERVMNYFNSKLNIVSKFAEKTGKSIDEVNAQLEGEGLDVEFAARPEMAENPVSKIFTKINKANIEQAFGKWSRDAGQNTRSGKAIAHIDLSTGETSFFIWKGERDVDVNHENAVPVLLGKESFIDVTDEELKNTFVFEFSYNGDTEGIEIQFEGMPKTVQMAKDLELSYQDYRKAENTIKDAFSSEFNVHKESVDSSRLENMDWIDADTPYIVGSLNKKLQGTFLEGNSEEVLNTFLKKYGYEPTEYVDKTIPNEVASDLNQKIAIFENAIFVEASKNYKPDPQILIMDSLFNKGADISLYHATNKLKTELSKKIDAIRPREGTTGTFFGLADYSGQYNNEFPTARNPDILAKSDIAKALIRNTGQDTSVTGQRQFDRMKGSLESTLKSENYELPPGETYDSLARQGAVIRIKYKTLDDYLKHPFNTGKPELGGVRKSHEVVFPEGVTDINVDIIYTNDPAKVEEFVKTGNIPEGVIHETISLGKSGT